MLLEVVKRILGSGPDPAGIGGSAVEAEAQARRELITRHTIHESQRSLRILVAEDNLVNQKLALTILRKRGHHVTLANDGIEALEHLERSTFDVVLMDAHMPRLGGFEATAEIREREKKTGTRTPIVALTALAMAGDRERCLAAGMDAYVTKPLRTDELLETLDRLVPGPATATAKHVPEPAPRQAQAAAIDEERLIRTADGDLDLVREIGRVFLDEHAEHLRRIEAAIAAGGASELERAAHTVKGMLQTLAADDAAGAAQRLEKMGRALDLRGADQVLAELRGEVTRMLPILGRLSQREAA
jgi:CheY-like chemotaxis protein/HPt (histidine-containing phosphotransfer) domain-containing protein